MLSTILLSLSISALAQVNQTDEHDDSKQKKNKGAVEIIEDVEVPSFILEEREASDNQSLSNFYSISQHGLNYVMPISYISDPNPIGVTELDFENVDTIEAKYQVSVKLPIYLKKDSVSGLYIGFTNVSYWQLYNNEVSRPFRENNYEPEVFYNWQTNYRFFGIKFNQARFGFNHQSNGQSGLISRSWNRIFASALFSDEDSIYYLKTWYRVPEEEKLEPNSAVGDDNPDITHFLGHFELGYGKKVGNFNILALLRNNLSSDNKGSLDLNISYPINERYDLVLQYFNGYGDSLIDYNRHQKRIGIGIQLKIF
jgi:phospholipase A1